MTYFAPSGARSNDSVRKGRSSGNMGITRQAPPVVVFCFGARHDDSVITPVDMLPFQAQDLRRAPQPTETAQGDNQPPVMVGALVEHPGDFFATHEVGPLFGDDRRAPDTIKWVLGYHVAFFQYPKKLPGEREPLRDGGLCKPPVNKVLLKIVAVAGSDLLGPLPFAEKLLKVFNNLPPSGLCCRLDVLSRLDVVIQERAELNNHSLLDQAYLVKLMSKGVGYFTEPYRRFAVGAGLRRLGGNESFNKG